MQPSKIHIASYDPNWSHLFNCEAERIRTILEKHVKEIHHIGSTAISNMPAKPVIDMLLVCDDIDSICLIQDGLKSMGYATLSRSVIPHRSFFTSRHNDPLIHYHLHLYEQGDPQINRHIHFKDYLGFFHRTPIMNGGSNLLAQLIVSSLRMNGLILNQSLGRWGLKKFHKAS